MGELGRDWLRRVCFAPRPAFAYRPDRLHLYAAESTHKSSCALYRRWALFAKELEALYDTFTKAGKAYTAKPQGAQPTEVQRCGHPPSGRGWGAHGHPGRGRVGVMGRGATTLRVEGVGAHRYLIGEELG